MKKQMIIVLLALLATGCTSLNARRAVSNSALTTAINSGQSVIYIKQEHIVPIEAFQKPQPPMVQAAGINWGQLAAPIIGELAGKLTDLEIEKLKARSNIATTGTELLLTRVGITSARDLSALIDSCTSLVEKSSMQHAVEGGYTPTSTAPPTDADVPAYPVENVVAQPLRVSQMQTAKPVKPVKAP